MSYMVISPYTVGLPCETLEAAESALYLLQCVGGFGQIVEVTEEPEVLTESKAAKIVATIPLNATAAVPPKPRGRPRKVQ